MPDIPFHVVGGCFTVKPPTQLIPSMQPLEPATAGLAPGSRRRRLWELPHKFHCPVIGVCFDVKALRFEMGKVMHIPANTTDFVLHTTAVSCCEERSRLADRLQKSLEKRFELCIQRYSAAKSGEALRSLWQEAAQSGSEIPAALWAAWTHPCCDAQLEQAIYADIHMIQHQIGSGTRSDLKTLASLRGENRELQQMHDKLRQETARQQRDSIHENRALTSQVAELRSEIARRDACIANLTAQLDSLRASLPELKDRQVLARRASDAEARAEALTALAASQETSISRLQHRLQKAEDSARQFIDKPESARPATAPPPANEAISGKNVLCVGGRSGSIEAYRQLVEQYGGRFLHHDGGLEESMHRIQAALNAADLVVCQAGCISHNAYWRVKEQCKRTGKPCIFLKKTGVSSFHRAVSAACNDQAELAE